VSRPVLSLSVSPAVDPRQMVEVAMGARDWGYEAFWGAEVQGPDAFTTLGAVAAMTDLDLGVAVVPVQTRTAFVLGMTAISLSQLSGGRFSLGIGASSEVIVDRFAGQPFDKPLTHTREMFEALRPILRGELSRYAGEYVHVAYRPHATPSQPVPLYIGALNPKSLRTVGEVGADGLCLNQVAPEHVARMLDTVRDGAGGSLPSDFRVMARLFCLVTDDVDAARGIVKHVFAPYVATSVYNSFYRWMGYEEEAQGVLDAAGDRDAMAGALSDRLAADLFCIGDARSVVGRIREYGEAGLDIAAISPLALDRDGAVDTWKAIADAW